MIQDDYTLKKFGVVYDQTGFDGLNKDENIMPIGTEERLIQRSKSAANIWFKGKYPKLSYDAYGAENQLDEIVPNWRIYKVLMIGGKGESTFLKVCLPLDESETALVSDKDEACLNKVLFYIIFLCRLNMWKRKRKKMRNILIKLKITISSKRIELD